MSFSVLIFLLISAVCASSFSCPSIELFQTQLGARLSARSSIEDAATSSALHRWNPLDAPEPRFVVNIRDEQDVAPTIKYCNEMDLKFYVSGQRVGWANTYSLGTCAVAINLAGLDKIEVHQDRTQVTIQGGVRTKELLDAAYSNNTRVTVPNCNCVGWMGAALGGGLSRTSGVDGSLSEQIISANLVTASGEMLTVSSESHTEMFWAIKGAGPNFGVVTSAVLKAYPTPQESHTAWSGVLVLGEEQIEEALIVLGNMERDPRLEFHFWIATDGTEANKPVFGITPFYFGDEATAMKLFKPVLDLKPMVVDELGHKPYPEVNSQADQFCVFGLRRSLYSAITKTVDTKTWIKVFQDYKKLTQHDGVGKTAHPAILCENYPPTSADRMSIELSSYAHRHERHHVVIYSDYEDSRLDSIFQAWGKTTRDLLRSTSGFTPPITYANFARGDEDLSSIYGDSLARLQDLKKKYDPLNRFDQFFPLIGREEAATLVDQSGGHGEL